MLKFLDLVHGQIIESRGLKLGKVIENK